MTDELLAHDQFGVPFAQRQTALLARLNELTNLHASACPGYARILSALWPNWREPAARLEDVPFVPVDVFKHASLKSVDDRDVIATITSSGTTGQNPSRIALDRHTATLQTTALARILRAAIGPDRLPLLIVDRPSEMGQQHARAIGIRGMLPMSKFHVFALNEDMSVNEDAIDQFLAKTAGGSFVMFGFTFVVWQFLQELTPRGVDLGRGTLIHSGGWKKLAALGISAEAFRTACMERAKIAAVHNFYGMAEQVGSVFLEGGDGTLRTPACADVVIRDSVTFQPVPHGSRGLIQVLSGLPFSYPGHSILTEDFGEIVGVDDAKDGWLGTRFRVLGRAPRAELRGCSDVIGAQS